MIVGTSVQKILLTVPATFPSLLFNRHFLKIEMPFSSKYKHLLEKIPARLVT